jgi:hypothetical protein
MYGYTTSRQNPAVNHADHNVEEWRAYVNDISEAPAYVNGDSSGLCCHDCELIIVDYAGPFCDCGAPVDIGGPLEDEHFIFAGRRDGSRSNLGYCPVKHGKAEAIRRARWELGTGLAIFHGRAI